MNPIVEGAVGAAVEDIQSRLAALGYDIDQAEHDEQRFGTSTAAAVARFRLEHGLTLGTEVDVTTWSTLVDEGYRMGDRVIRPASVIVSSGAPQAAEPAPAAETAEAPAQEE